MPAPIRQAFEQLYAAQAPAIFQLCLGYAKGDATHAADLAQGVWLAAWRSWDQYAGAASAKTWLYRVAVNSCLGDLRRVRSRPRIVTDEVPARASDLDEGARDLYEAIGLLPEVDRLVLMLTLEGFGYEEVAAVLGSSPAALRVRAHRARQRLKRLLDAC